MFGRSFLSRDYDNARRKVNLYRVDILVSNEKNRDLGECIENIVFLIEGSIIFVA